MSLKKVHKGQEDSTRLNKFKKVLEASKGLRKVQKGFMKVQRDQKFRYTKAQEDSTRFNKVQEGSRTSWAEQSHPRSFV